VSISSNHDINSTKADCEYDSVHDSDVYVCLVDDVNALDSVDLDGDVDIEMDGEDEEDEEEEDEEEVEEVNEHEEDKHEHNGKELQTVGQGDMINTSADITDTMVDNQPTVLPEHSQEMHDHTPWPQLPVPAPQPQTPEPCL
jgi:hypothetical protein